tara:strand:- start:5 stop:388 length:384 start_codon:yes stop_codon:yes gene_type:complete
MKNKILFVFIILFIFTNNVFPQCAMCKAVVEANLESGDTKEKYDKFEEITKWYSPFYGKGTYTWANGNKYVGEWKDDMFNGQGTYTTKSWEYVGEWKDGRCHGQGTKTWSDGAVFKGLWENGEFLGE